jgi:AAHS family 4-hydroxybenzoate transporter-like MFS transporter
LGGMLAAYLAGLVIPVYGWRTLFAMGGILPILLGLVLFKVLPESPKYLAGRREKWSELSGLLRRFGHNVPQDAAFADASAGGKVTKRASVGELFTPDLRLSTIGLFGSFFFCLMSNYIIISWLVTMLTGAGFAQPAASNILAGSNMGGVAGAILAALVIQRFGSRVTMLTLSAMSVVVALVLAVMPLDPNATTGLFVMVALAGCLMNAVQTTMYALAAHVYPTAIRGTGVGTAVAVGRIGHVLSAYVGSWALAGGPSTYFMAVAVTMAVVFGSLALVRRHIERTTGGETAPAKVAAPASH